MAYRNDRRSVVELATRLASWWRLHGPLAVESSGQGIPVPRELRLIAEQSGMSESDVLIGVGELLRRLELRVLSLGVPGVTALHWVGLRRS